MKVLGRSRQLWCSSGGIATGWRLGQMANGPPPYGRGPLFFSVSTTDRIEAEKGEWDVFSSELGSLGTRCCCSAAISLTETVGGL